MGSVSLSRSRAYSSSGWGSWQSCPRSGGIDYCYHADQTVVYEADLSFDSGDTLTSVSVSTNFALYQYSHYGQDNHDTSITCYLYTSNPTGSSGSPPSGYIATATSGSVNIGYWGKFLTFTFSSVQLTSGSNLYFWFYDNASHYENDTVYKDAVYHYNTGNGHTSTPTVTGTWNGTPPTPTDYCTVTLTAGTGIASVSPTTGRVTKGSAMALNCTVQSGYYFDSWRYYTSGVIGNVIDTNQSGFLWVTFDVGVIAIANPKCTVTPIAGNNITSVSGGGQKGVGESCTVSAVIPSNTDYYSYEFDGWYSDNVKVSSDIIYTFSVTGSITLTAVATRTHKGFVTVNFEDTFRRAVAYIRKNSEWKAAVPYVYHDGAWVLCGIKTRPPSPLFSVDDSTAYQYAEYWDGQSDTLHWEMVFTKSTGITFARLPTSIDVCAVGGGSKGQTAYTTYTPTTKDVGGTGGNGASPVTSSGISLTAFTRYAITIGSSQSSESTTGNATTGFGVTGTGAAATPNGGAGATYNSSKQTSAYKGANGVKAFNGQGLTVLTSYDKFYGAYGGGAGFFVIDGTKSITQAPGAGGTYGGGAGGMTGTGSNATDNSGSGGGGGGFTMRVGGEFVTYAGGNGGSGILIIRDHR